MNKHNSPAFTLILLLVVISIIAVLAALAVPALTQALTKGQMTGTMKQCATALSRRLPDGDRRGRKFQPSLLVAR
jgi:type II secretory pathway pseudopilin PulG